MLKLLFIAITAATAATAAAAANVPANAYLPSEYDDESECMYI